MDARGASVSEAELEVLKVLWEHAAGTVREINNILQVTSPVPRLFHPAAGTVREINNILQGQGRRWAYTTVQTLLQRLESKGYVHSDRSGPAHIYRAAVSREELLSRRLWELADQFCDGTASPLLLALVGDSRLSAEEIKQLRQLLDQLQPPKRPRPRSG